MNAGRSDFIVYSKTQFLYFFSGKIKDKISNFEKCFCPYHGSQLPTFFKISKLQVCKNARVSK